MDKVLPAVIIVIVVAVILSLMVHSWRKRGRAQAHLPELTAVPADTGEVIGSFDGLYLATTPAGEPLNRITVRDLGFRQRGRLVVTSAGFILLGDRFIPIADVTGVSRASWTIDRGVEPDGLSVISWSLGGTPLDSYFRLDDPEGFIAAASSITQQTGQK